jgi:hypothetical protein
MNVGNTVTVVMIKKYLKIFGNSPHTHTDVTTDSFTSEPQ